MCSSRVSTSLCKPFCLSSILFCHELCLDCSRQCRLRFRIATDRTGAPKSFRAKESRDGCATRWHGLPRRAVMPSRWIPCDTRRRQSRMPAEPLRGTRPLPPDARARVRTESPTEIVLPRSDRTQAPHAKPSAHLLHFTGAGRRLRATEKPILLGIVFVSEESHAASRKAASPNLISSFASPGLAGPLCGVKGFAMMAILISNLCNLAS